MFFGWPPYKAKGGTVEGGCGFIFGLPGWENTLGERRDLKRKDGWNSDLISDLTRSWEPSSLGFWGSVCIFQNFTSLETQFWLLELFWNSNLRFAIKAHPFHQFLKLNSQWKLFFQVWKKSVNSWNNRGREKKGFKIHSVNCFFFLIVVPVCEVLTHQNQSQCVTMMLPRWLLTTDPECAKPDSLGMMLPELCSHPLSVAQDIR